LTRTPERDSARKSIFLFDMFKKILVAEDFDTYNVAIAEALKNFPIESEHVSYCDEALIRIKKGLQSEEPYELLISDLSFKPDDKRAMVKSGFALIKEAKRLSPDLRVIAYSIENRTHPIRQLFDELEIDGYVLKGRNNIPELKKAIQSVHQGKRYLSPEIAHLVQDRSLEEIEDYDVHLLKLLSNGTSQVDISLKFQKDNISPNSISSVEKRLNRLKTILEANNNVHLVAIAKDLGLI